MTQQNQIPQPTLPDPFRQSPKRSRLWLWIALAVLVAAGSGAGAVYLIQGQSQPTVVQPQSITIQGNITVPASLDSQGFKGGDCVSDDGYTDVAVGAEVTITNQSGTVIKTGRLADGHTADVVPDANGGADIPFHCTYHFLIDGIPDDATTYGISIGNTFRGVVHFTRAQLAEPVDLNLG